MFESLLICYPEFLEKNLHWQTGPENETPDFIGTSDAGKRFGVELTEWLDEKQTGVSISNQEARFKLLNAINSEGVPCPEPLTQVLICDRLDVPFRKADLQNYSRELYHLIAYCAPRWKDNQVWGIWNVKDDLASYRTLSRYCVRIVFYGPPRLCESTTGIKWNALGSRWINFEPVGGAYDPQWGVDALLSRIQAKIGKYSGIHSGQKLDHFALLVHYGIRGMIHNTPYHGRNTGLEDATKRAHKILEKDHGEFDSAYLYMTNTRKLIDEWVARFPDTLRPNLLRRRYQADAERLLALDLQAHHDYWGGEVAGQRLTGYLRPERFTLYIEDDDKILLTQARMRLDPNGNTEILQAFWNLPTDEKYPDVVPPLLAYADLIATEDGRNLETARLIYDKFLEPMQG